MLSLCDPVIGKEEKEALATVIESGWLTMGKQVAAFEQAFADLHGVEAAVAVNSCTAGLHLCLTSLGIGPGDEVLAPSLSFVATTNAVLYAGATPVFVDIQTVDRPHISLTDAEAKRTAKTKAVIVMHYAGYPVNLPLWRDFCDAHGLFLIEDAAHSPAVGEVGRLSDACAFSFFSNKNMTTAEGGMVFARNPETLGRVRKMRGHGMTSNTLDRQRGHAFSYDVTMFGHNYRLDELRAAIGLAQLKHLPAWNQTRREHIASYRKILAEHGLGVTIPFDPEDETAGHLMPILLPTGTQRSAVMAKLRQAGVQSSIHYPPIHTFSYYRALFPGVSLPVTEHFCSRELTLPLHPQMDEEDIEKVIQALQSTLQRDNIWSGTSRTEIAPQV